MEGNVISVLWWFNDLHRLDIIKTVRFQTNVAVFIRGTWFVLCAYKTCKYLIIRAVYINETSFAVKKTVVLTLKFYL